jgi:hypothetical protein
MHHYSSRLNSRKFYYFNVFFPYEDLNHITVYIYVKTDISVSKTSIYISKSNYYLAKLYRPNMSSCSWLM